MLNAEKYKQQIEDKGNPRPNCYIAQKIMKNDCDRQVCSVCNKKIIRWLLEEYKEPILTDKEKAYLKNVIEPRRDEIVYIKKTGFYKGMKKDYCCVSVYSKNLFSNVGSHWTLLEFLTTEDMSFEGMTIDKKYTLEELGL